MDRTEAIEQLCANVETWWRFYTESVSIIPVLLVHDGLRWSWCPLYIEFTDMYEEDSEYVEALRRNIWFRDLSAAAIAGKEHPRQPGGRFYVLIQFRGDPHQHVIVWDIDGERLSNRRTPAPAEAIEYVQNYPSLFDPPLPTHAGWHADLMLLIHFDEPEFEVLQRIAIFFLLRKMGWGTSDP
jgi:hypothetical protein